MTDNPFAAPAPPSSGIQWSELKGRLLLVRPIAVETGIQTAYGTSDAVRADVIVLDGDNPGEEHLDTLVFPKVLRSQLARQIGSQVLGRLGQGQAKSSQSPPWMLYEASPQDQQIAYQWLQRQMTPPPQPQQSPAQQPQGQWQPQQQPQQGWQPPQPQQGQDVPF